MGTVYKKVNNKSENLTKILKGAAICFPGLGGFVHDGENRYTFRRGYGLYASLTKKQKAYQGKQQRYSQR